MSKKLSTDLVREEYAASDPVFVEKTRVMTFLHVNKSQLIHTRTCQTSTTIGESYGEMEAVAFEVCYH